MPVPEEVRKVPRPVNTVVVENKAEGLRKYAVRARKGLKRIPGKHSRPVNGPVIGYIFNGEYIPLEKVPEIEPPDTPVYRYGGHAFACSVSEDILQDLLAVFPLEDARSVYVIAVLRAVCQTEDWNPVREYRDSFLNVQCPGVSLAPLTRHELFARLGADPEGRQRWNRARTSRISRNDIILVAGTVRQFSAASDSESSPDASGVPAGGTYGSVLCAYDIGKEEPICAGMVPGGSAGPDGIASFIEGNQMEKGILLFGRGFPLSKALELCGKHPELHFLIPLKRNDPRIDSNRMTDFTGELPGHSGILYRKAQAREGIFLYSFCDIDQATRETLKYMGQTAESPDFMERLRKKHPGVLVLESDLDLDPGQVYGSHARWRDVETLFRQIKNEEMSGERHFQDEDSVVGSDFVTTLAAIITSRMKKACKDSGLTDNDTFDHILAELNQVWRRKGAPEPVTGDAYWDQATPRRFEILEALGLSKPQEPVPKRDEDPTPGNEESADLKGPKEPDGLPPVPDPPRRKRGRPRKIPVEQPAADQPKRKRGRPRKNPTEEPAADKPKRKPGRPRKNPVEQPAADKPKRPRGRPRKHPVEQAAVNQPKRPRGRPRKNPIDQPAANQPKRAWTTEEKL